MISIIAAIAKNNCIGKNGTLPWHLPEDLKRFRTLTTGNVVIMGRKTWDSIPEKFRPLPNRVNVVITHQEHFAVPEGVIVYSSLEAALQAYADQNVMIIGGSQIYAAAMSHAKTLHITHVDQEVDGDAFFPTIDKAIWKEIEHEEHPGYTFSTYAR
jgi:dihydrofolate reductase